MILLIKILLSLVIFLLPLIGGKNDTVDYTGAGFGLDILNELPAWRKKDLPQYIQDQLN